MTDISGLQSIWQKEFGPLDQDETNTLYKEQEYLQKLETLGEKYNNEPSKLRYKLAKPFVIATRIAPLRRKEMKLESHLKADESKIKELAVTMLSNLADATARDSVTGPEFKYMETAIGQMLDAQQIVINAANKCRNASAAKAVTAVSDEIPVNTTTQAKNDQEALIDLATVLIKAGADFTASAATYKATHAMQDAEQAVLSLQTSVREEIPRVNGEMARDISESNSTAFMMDTMGGILASFSNLKTADQLYDAKTHLHKVADQLGTIISRLDGDKRALADSALKTARACDPSIAKFAAELETAMLPMETRKTIQKPGLAL